MKKYKAIFFDWDGTAVLSRRAPAEEAIAAMKPLLAKGIRLIIVSGTTIENIAQGKLEEQFTPAELANLYLGLGRGAYNYAFVRRDEPQSPIAANSGKQEIQNISDNLGKAYLFEDKIPDKAGLLKIHQICFDIHKELLEKYNFPTDIVFTRPNYCKIDLMVEQQRGDNLFLQESEVDHLKELLSHHGITGGLQSLLDLSLEIGRRYGLTVVPTCDAKYLEVGISSKSDNVDVILEKLHQEAGVEAQDCAFWGDEYVGIEPNIYGSDSCMRTEKTRFGDFFDVSTVPGARPDGVQVIGGGVDTFLDFLRAQARL